MATLTERRLVRLALLRLAEDPPLSLGRSRLARLLMPDERDQLGRGKVLHMAFAVTIEQLQPPGTVAHDDPRWWPYLIHRGEHLGGRSRATVRHEMAISQSAYTRAKRRGLDGILTLLPHILAAMGCTWPEHFDDAPRRRKQRVGRRPRRGTRAWRELRATELMRAVGE